MLKYLKHSEIDKAKWDYCVNTAVNPMVYNLSDYLNIIHDNWEGYVYEVDNCYLGIMPLLLSQKVGFKILKKPILAQQLGFTYTSDCNASEVFKELIKELTQSYQIIEYPLNYQNSPLLTEGNEKKHFDRCATQVLDLNRTYSATKSCYRRDRRARLKQATANKLSVSTTSNSEVLLHLFSENVESKIEGGVDLITLENIRRLVDWGISSNIGFLYLVSDIDQKPVSAGYFTFFQNRWTYLFGATSEKGKLLQANSFLLDYVIQNNCEQEYILDFEGSTVEGIRDFYKSFGSSDESFYMMNYQTSFFQTLLTTRKKIHQLLNP